MVANDGREGWVVLDKGYGSDGWNIGTEWCVRWLGREESKVGRKGNGRVVRFRAGGFSNAVNDLSWRCVSGLLK